VARLLVLWLLNERPMHGYQIKKALADDGMAFWFALEDASIYSVLRTLAKKGYVVERAETGSVRPRTVYRITPEGRTYYQTLLANALAVPSSTVGPIDVALSARGDLDPTTISSSLAARGKHLHEQMAEMERGRRAAPSNAMVDRNLALVRAEVEWLEHLDHSSIS